LLPLYNNGQTVSLTIKNPGMTPLGTAFQYMTFSTTMISANLFSYAAERRILCAAADRPHHYSGDSLRILIHEMLQRKDLTRLEYPAHGTNSPGTLHPLPN